MTVDLNADLGESYGRWTLGDDAAMLGLISSANIACGFHAGDPTTLRLTCRGAIQGGVTIGAQVSYPDLLGFGRRFIDMAPADLTAAVIYQLGALSGLARSEGGRVRYLKPHGALYNTILDHQAQATAIVEAVLSFDPDLPVVGLAGSVFVEIASQWGLRTVAEHFVDRAYTNDGRLVDRRLPNAMITDPDVAAARAVQVAQSGSAETLCIHGDSPGAVVMATRVRTALEDAGVDIRPFVVDR